MVRFQKINSRIFRTHILSGFIYRIDICSELQYVKEWCLFIYLFIYFGEGKKVSFDIFYSLVFNEKKFAVISSLSASGTVICSCNTFWPKGILPSYRVIS